MSSSCPNKSHPAWKALVKKTGSEIGAYKQYINNNFSIPSSESKQDVLFQKNQSVSSEGKISKGLTDIVPKVNIVNYRNITNDDKRKAVNGDLNAQKKWMQEEISEFYEAVDGFNKGTMSIDDVGEEVLGLFRTAQQFSKVKDAIVPYMNDIKTALNSIDKEDQYNKFKAKKTSKGQAEDMTFKNLFEFINSFKEIKPGVQELFESNTELSNAVYEALGFDKQINEIADTRKVNEFIKKYKDALPNIKDGKTLISHLQTVSNRNTGTTKQFADLIIKLSKSNKGLEKLLNNPNLYAKPNSVGDEGAFHWSLFNNLSVNKIVLELDHFKTNTYDDVFLHELIHNLTTQFIVKDSDLFNQSFYNKVKELYSVFDNHLEANKKVNEPLLKSTKNDVKNLKSLKEFFEALPSDAIQQELLFGKIGSVSKVKEVSLDYKSLENKSKQDVIKELERLLSFKESRIQEIEKGDKDYYYFNSKTFKQESVLSEFLATFMNDANFREQLKNIGYKNNKSIFQSIIDLISEFIGLTKNDSLYNEFVLNLTNFINNNNYSTIAEQTQKTAYQNRINLLEQQKQQALQLYSQYLDTKQPDVILPIGTSGSGKSTFIKSLLQENLVIIEPDAMRVEFTGDINDKSKDKEIYIEAANRAVQAIKQGKQVVFDTTNLTKDKRLPFIEAIKKEIPTANIQYKLMELNPELAKQRIKAQLARGENRAAVSDETIDRHAASYKQMLEDIKSEPTTEYNILGNKQDIENFSNFVKNNNEFYQITSNELEDANKQLDDYLLNFVKPFGVTFKEVDDLKNRLGKDSLGVADTLNKLITLSKNRKIDTVPEEVGHLVVMLMGKTHPEIKSLLNSIEKWSGYKNVENEYEQAYSYNMDQVKIEAIGKLLAKAIVKNFKEQQSDVSIFTKARKVISEFFAMLEKILPFGKNFYTYNLANKIAKNILLGNTSYVSDFVATNSKLNYQKTVEENPFGKYIIDTFTKRFGLELTGSLAVAAQGETIYRPETEPIHDLDFVVTDRTKMKEISEFMKNSNALPVHNGIKHDLFTTVSYYLPKKGYTVIPLLVKGYGYVKEIGLLNEKGERVNPSAENVISVDFFVNNKITQSASWISSWQDVFKGKLFLSPIMSAERMFDRDKDQKDYVLSNPINREKELPEFTYLQLQGEPESSKASSKTVAVVKDFLKRIGVDIKSLTGIVVNGVKQDANGAALIMQKIVQVVEGKEDVALTEEAMHFAVEILKQTNPTLYKQLLKEINSYNLYAQVLRDYSSNPLYQTKDGKPDIQKLKDEAIAKVLTEKIINKSEGQTEKPDLLQKSEGWWKSMITWFKELFSKSGFDRATMDILSGKDIGTAEDIIAEENKVYLQKTKQDLSIEEMLRVDKSITKKETGKTIDGKKEEAYFIDGRQIKKRVTEIIKDWYKGVFRDSKILESDYNKSINDLKAEKGTAGHADLEYAFSRFVDENGYLRDVELKDDVDFQSKINPTDNDMYYTLKDNLRERLKSFPEGTRFFKEMQVYDAKRDIAGTIDFLAIEKDGKVNILDWKFMNLNLEKYTDIPWYKINAWNQQMAQYKLILINSYGFKSQDFKQTRMIPIIANYSKGSARQNILPKLTSIEIGDQNVQNIQKDYLLPVALVEETTGDKKFDKLISDLTSIYKEMSQKRIVNEEEKKNKAEQLNALFKAMRQLQIKQNIFPLVEQAKVLALEVERVIAEYKQKFEGKDASLFTEEERDEYSKKLTEMSTALAVYTDLSANLSFLFKNRILSEEDKQLRNLLRQTSADAQDLKTALSDIDEEFVVEHIGKSEGEKDISLKEKTIRGASKWFSSTVTTQLSSLRVLYRKVNRQLFNASQEAVDESRKLETKKQKYDEWARSKGLSAKNYFNIIKKKNSNELIDEWDPEFFKILKEATTNKEAEDYKWIAENIDIDAYRDHLAKKLEDELIRIDNKVRLITDENREFVEFEIEQEKQKARNIYTIDKPTSPGFLLYSDIKKFPLKKWHSPEWKTLTSPGNEAAKDFYDYIIEKNKEYAEIGYISKSEARVFLPWVRKSLTEKLIFGGKISLGEQFLKSISIDDSVTGYGQINPITGKLIDKIPKYLISEIEDVADVSEELFKTMSLYNDFALKFKYLSQIENQAQAIIRLERNKKSIRTSKWGNAVMVNGEISENPDNSENAQLIEDTVKGIIYGQKYLESETFDQLYGKISNFGEKFNKKLGMKIFPENLGERSLSINRTIDQLNKVFQLRTLGLNPLSSISNLLGGSFQSIINAGKYFTKSDFVATEMWLFGEKMKQHAGMYPEKTLAAFEYFLPLTENYNREISKKLALNKLNQENVQDFLMMLMRNSDMAVQTTNFFTYLKNSVIINGEIVNVREYLKTTPEYFDIYKGSKEQRIALQKKFEEDVKKLVKEKGVLELSEVKNGKLVIPGITRKDESVVDLRRKVQNLNRAALGNIAEDEIRKINQNIYGKSFMVFKNWIPQLVATRTANLQFNNASDAYEWGRLRMVFRILKEDGIKSLKTIIDTYQGNESAIVRIRELYEKKKNEYEDETGKEFKMTQGEFIELVRQNMKNAITDGLITLTLLGLLISLKANAPDDDDDDEIIKNQYKFLLKATDKITDELLYFYDPRNLLHLLKGGLFPSSSLIENYIKILENFSIEMFALGTGDEKLQEKTKVLKYVMKSFPIMYQMEQMLPMFYPEMAKDLGITMSSEAKPKI